MVISHEADAVAADAASIVDNMPARRDADSMAWAAWAGFATHKQANPVVCSEQIFVMISTR
jgi:hypothetical protein